MAETKLKPEQALGTGAVVQVVGAVYNTQTNVTSSSFTDSGLTATITPKSASNKILVMFNMGEMKVEIISSGFGVRLLRGTTPIHTIGNYFGYQSANTRIQVSGAYLDSPSTTTAVTYKVDGNRPLGSGTNVFQEASSYSSMILMEVVG